jgi:hypothetical protein
MKSDIRSRSIPLFGFFVQRVLAAKPTVFIKCQFIRRRAFVFGRGVISSFALTACKGNNYSHQKDSL